MSVAFSKKVFPLSGAPTFVRDLTFAIWVMCFVAFTQGGGAIFFVCNAGVLAKASTVKASMRHADWQFKPTYIDLVIVAQWLLALAGILFASALGLFVLIALHAR